MGGLVGYYTGESWARGKWMDLSPAGNHVTTTSGPITSDHGTVNGKKYVSGNIDARLVFPRGILSATYTLFHITRYMGPNRARIITGTNVNWLSGHHSGNSGVSYQGYWMTPVAKLHGDAWFLSTDQPGIYRSQRQHRATTRKNTDVPPLMGINVWTGTYFAKHERSDWACACVIIYSRILSHQEYGQVEAFLLSQYGV
jgi:hypothetical protein